MITIGEMCTPEEEWNNKDEIYIKRRDEFHVKLFKFHKDNNNSVKRVPLLGGRELDLYHLYLKVKSLGGSKRITQDRLWGDVARSFNLPASVTSASYACRQNFIKYLEPYERYEAGEQPFIPLADIGPRRLTFQPTLSQPSQPSPSPSNNSFLVSKFSHLTSVPGFANLLKQVERSPELIGQLANLPSLLQLPPNQLQLVQLLLQQMAAIHATKGKGGEKGAFRGSGKNCGWLVRSLECGLPNEVDLCMNCLLIMSSEEETNGREGLLVQDVPHLLPMLLAHVGVFNSDETSLESLYVEWYSQSEIDFLAFWQEVVPEWVCLTALANQFEDTSRMSFFPERAVLTHDAIESFRATQVSLIIRNLSLSKRNAQYFAKCDSTLRFLLLCLNSSLPELKNQSLDALAGIAPYLVIEGDDDDSISHLLLMSVYSCVLSYDRNSIIRGMEILGGFSLSVCNKATLINAHSDLLNRMLQLSLLPDYLLAQTCLETLYKLSLCGRKLSESILHCDSCIKILLSFLTLSVEDRSLHGLVVFHSNGKEESAVLTNQVPPQESLSGMISATKSLSGAGQVTGGLSASSKGLTGAKIKGPALPFTPSSISNASGKQLPTGRQPVAAKVDKPAVSSESLLESKLTFAIQWLQSEYIPSQEEFIPKLDIYSKYLGHCAQLKYTTAATQPEFDLIFRKVFPSAFFASIKIGGKDLELVGGIGVNKKQNLFSSPAKTPTPPPPPISLPSSAPSPLTVSNKSTTITTGSVSLQQSSPIVASQTTASLPQSVVSVSQITASLSQPVVSVSQAMSSVSQTTVSVPQPLSSSVPQSVVSVSQTMPSVSQTTASVPQIIATVSQTTASISQTIQSVSQPSNTTVQSSGSIGPQQLTSVLSQSMPLVTSVPSQSIPLATSVPSQSVSLVTSVPSQSMPLVTSVPSQSVPLATSVPLQSQQSSSSRSPSPSLSPLQQLIQATKTHSTANSKTTAKPSPLIQFKKVSAGKGSKKKSPKVNGSPTFNSITYPHALVNNVNNSMRIPLSLAAVQDITSNEGGLESGGTIGKASNTDSILCTNDTVMEVTGFGSHTLNGLSSTNGVMRSIGKRERSVDAHATGTNPTKKQKTDLTESNKLHVTQFLSSHFLKESSNSSNGSLTTYSSPQRSNQRSVSPAATSDKGSSTPSHRNRSSSPSFTPKPVPVTSLVSNDSLRSAEHSPGPSSSSLSTPPPPDCLKSTCLWENCFLRYSSYSELFSHIYYTHIPQINSFPVPCPWSGCSNKSKRMKPSLIRHIQTHHCSSDSKPVPLNVADTLIKLKLVSPLQNEHESCFTRCLRLTAALILRNLLDKVPESRRYVKPYERLLSQVSFSDNEASHVTAHCLFLLSSPLPPLSTPTSPTFS
ncbi:PREDICTED: AT-rich interactive domain-containing protein 2-like [Amphimedon queenslandica]|uniref:ARID domain-containing protein n=1 Tax=Amphimedon queenslandica TaxID=400682 RepID=A0A1X7UP05_AMPQE|nr:PREDICTED: AT-rich interactive domain-containing protein 2-like [Amphimedon queenslandica]|eukprot:XP_019853176.1 PREDICTED: AT-rich interactive domain-containing protein 2-like [Amphimedon queenslandica]